MPILKAFITDEAGATAIEYGLISALVAVALISSFLAFGDSLLNLLGSGAGSAAGVIEAQTAKVR
jgi:pilus assembly protein Flp/PilA